MELLLVVPLAVVVALVTLVLCDLAGGIARAKGRSYWLFFVFGLLLWFPALITALTIADRNDVPAGPEPGRGESVLGKVVLALGALAAVAGVVAAVAFAP